MDNSLTYLLLAGIGFIVTVPVLLYLFHRFWQLRSHFVISRRLPQFSISIVILSMISYSIGIYPFVLRYLGMIETETEWLEHLAVPTAMAQVITAIILYRAYLIYVRGKRASRALTKNIDELHSIYYNDDDIEQDSKTSNSIRSRPSLPKRASVQKERKLVEWSFRNTLPWFVLYAVLSFGLSATRYIHNVVTISSILWTILTLVGIGILFVSRKTIEVLGCVRETQIVVAGIFIEFVFYRIVANLINIVWGALLGLWILLFAAFVNLFYPLYIINSHKKINKRISKTSKISLRIYLENSESNYMQFKTHLVQCFASENLQFFERGIILKHLICKYYKLNENNDNNDNNIKLNKDSRQRTMSKSRQNILNFVKNQKPILENYNVNSNTNHDNRNSKDLFDSTNYNENHDGAVRIPDASPIATTPVTGPHTPAMSPSPIPGELQSDTDDIDGVRSRSRTGTTTFTTATMGMSATTLTIGTSGTFGTAVTAATTATTVTTATTASTVATTRTDPNEIVINWDDINVNIAGNQTNEDEKNNNMNSDDELPLDFRVRIRAASNIDIDEVNNRLNNSVFSIKFEYLGSIYRAYSKLIDAYTKRDKNDLTPLWIITSSLYQQFISPNSTEQINLPGDEIDRLQFIFSEHRSNENRKHPNGIEDNQAQANGGTVYNSPNKYLTSPTDFLNIFNPAMLEVWNLLDTIFSFRFDAKPPTRMPAVSASG